jgi:hypothetical protein
VVACIVETAKLYVKLASIMAAGQAVTGKEGSKRPEIAILYSFKYEKRHVIYGGRILMKTLYVA